MEVDHPFQPVNVVLQFRPYHIQVRPYKIQVGFGRKFSLAIANHFCNGLGVLGLQTCTLQLLGRGSVSNTVVLISTMIAH